MFFKKKFENRNDDLNSVSQLLYDEENPLPLIEFFKSNRHKFDYSVESLIEMDNYLETLMTKKLIADNEVFSRIVLRIGAYVGEVIRKNAGKEFNWFDFKTACKIDNSLHEFGECVQLAAVLHTKVNKVNNEFVFPLNKVSQFLENGREDSLKFFAAVIIER